VNAARQSIAVLIIFRKWDKNSPGLQQVLKMLLSSTNALHVPAEYVVINALEFLPGNCCSLEAEVA
jgi:hypothetical protein